MMNLTVTSVTSLFSFAGMMGMEFGESSPAGLMITAFSGLLSRYKSARSARYVCIFT